MSDLKLFGRSSSHFTRVPWLFAHELGVPVELVPIHDITSDDAKVYGGNPALKLPTLCRADGGLVFGAENICRALAELSVELSVEPRRIIWPEMLRGELTRNAQELVWHGMAAQVQLIFGTVIAALPVDNVYFTKSRAGFEGALRWLNAHLADVLRALPSPRDLSLFEVTLFCLMEHVAFRRTLPTGAYPELVRFTEAFSKRASAERTAYRFDPAPSADPLTP